MSNNNDYRSSIRAWRSTIDRLSEYGEDVFGTNQVPNDALINHLLDAQE